LCQA